MADSTKCCAIDCDRDAVSTARIAWLDLMKTEMHFCEVHEAIYKLTTRNNLVLQSSKRKRCRVG